MVGEVAQQDGEFETNVHSYTRTPAMSQYACVNAPGLLLT
jgi:hypothetical protein